MFVNNATELAHGVTVCSVPRPGGHGAACGGGSSGRGHSAPLAAPHFSPRLQGWSGPRKCPASPSLHRPRVIVCSPLGRGAFPDPSEASFPFSSWMEPPLALQAAGTILSLGILQSRIHHPRSGLREVFMDSRWQRLSVCPSPPVLPLLPFILLAPRTPLLPPPRTAAMLVISQ